jgi:primosomal protein N'
VERWHLLLQATSRKALRDLLRRALPEVRNPGLPGIRVIVDVDPRQVL